MLDDTSNVSIRVIVAMSLLVGAAILLGSIVFSFATRIANIPPPELSEPTAISEVFVDSAMASCIANDPESGANGNVDYLISQSELDGINDLSCQGEGVVNLEGMQYLTNLTALYLNANEITNVSPLSRLTNLEVLFLPYNQITDFSSLKYQPTSFSASPQAPIALPETTLGTPTPITIDGINGEDLIITFNTPGTYVNGQLTWDNPGVNSLTYSSADGKISGTITQTVTE